jgi:CSLREA domain-containing protein
MKNSFVLTKKLSRFALRLSWFLALTLVLLWLVGVGHASTFIVVNSTEDVKKNDGQCTLREAIIAANTDRRSGGRQDECPAGSGADTIILAADPDPVTGIAVYTLSLTDNGNEDSASTGDLDIFGDVILMPEPEPAVPGVHTIDASGITDRAFHILGGNVEISGVTITKDGTFTGDGAGIHNSGTLTLINSTVANTEASATGGGIYNAGVLTLHSSTLSGNKARDGGGIANASSGSVTLNNSTVSGNSATDGGGGIFNAGLLALHNGTIAHNSGGGIVNSDVSGTVNLRNTIIAGNGPDCSGTLSSQGYNLASDNTCGLTGTGDIANTDPLLGLLKDNGGETETHALLVNSPAIDAGDPEGCFGSNGLLAFDQRGEPRPIDGDSNGTFLCDIGAYEVGRGTLVLLRAFPNNGGTTVHGLLDGAVSTTINVNFFATCEPSEDFYEAINVPTDENGYFIVDIPIPVPGQFVTAKATDANGVPLQSNCVPFSAPNDSWPEAVELTLEPVGGSPRSAVVADQYIDNLGQSRWYKFEVEPNGKLFITLSGVGGPDAPLPADFDLTLYKDLEAAFQASLNPDSEDLVRLSAEFAGSSFSGSSFSGSSFSGSSFSGSSFSSISYSGSSFSGSSFSGSSFSGSSFSGSSFSGDAYIGSSFSGSSFSGSSFSGSSFSGSSFSEAVFGEENYSRASADAQSRSLLAISAFAGTVPESIFVRTWNSNEFYYVRVRGRNGAFSLDAPFRLEVKFEAGSCGLVESLEELVPGSTPIGPEGNPTTLILYDSSRLDRIQGSDEIDLVTKLNALADHPGVDGEVVDVNSDLRVQSANSQADKPEYFECPFAKNVVAQAIKEIVDGYRTQPDSNLQYVVLVGGDAVIPFFRHPDNADLARESQYVPPVMDGTPSQAALKLDYVLSQDGYVAKEELLINNNTFPIVDPNVAVGRLAETAAEISAVIDAFLDHTNNGVVQSQTSLVTGYDFLEDAALEIENQLRLGTGNEPDDLITPFDVPPTDPSAWTADQLRDALLGSRHDLVFLAGHFSGHSALAADYTTQMLAAEVANSTADMQNSIIFSVGCHAGYNIVNQDELPQMPRDPDWAQAFAGKGAALIAGTGYQYGETETVEYSEWLYIEFSKQLRRDTGGPISIGHALNKAKLAYLTRIPKLGALHEKALLEATIFGLPMLSVDLPERFTPALDTSTVTSLIDFDTNPGAALGLAYTNVDVTSPVNDPAHLEERMLRDITDPGNPRDVKAEFLTGSDFDIVTNPVEPFLPLEVRNVTVPGMVLRGVGFRGGTYKEKPNILPLTGAPTTEAVALHLSWQTDFFHPIQMWNANYIGTLIDGQTRVLFTPAQHIAGNTIDEIRKSHRRQFSEMNFRLFYSNNVDDFDGHIPALSAPPAITRVSAIPDDEKVTFRATVVGDPSAGMQSVWVIWTDTGVSCPADGDASCAWQSLDLTQRESDTTLWEGTLLLNGIDSQNIRYMVQAVNGFGRVGLATNFGHFFTPGADAVPSEPTELTLEFPDGATGTFGSQHRFSAVLTSGEQPLPGQTIEFRLGEGLRSRGVTDSEGRATVTLNLLELPDEQKLRAGFEGTDRYQASSAVAAFKVNEQITSLADFSDATAFPNQDPGMVVTLLDQNDEPLRERTVFFVVTDPADPNTALYSAAQITNIFGQASLGPVPLDPGTYTVTAYFNNYPLVVLTSDAYKPVSDLATLTIVTSPCDAGGAVAIIHDPDDPDGPPPPSIWPPNDEFWTVDVQLVNNPTGQVTVIIDGIFQDEPVSNVGPDARAIEGDTDSVELRAERDGSGNGRVYHIFFSVDDGQGFTCSDGEVTAAVIPHDQSGDPGIDEGALHDSTEVPKNDPPVANDDSNTTDEDTAVTGNVLANDTDDNTHDVLTVVAVNDDANAVGTEFTLPSGARLTVQTTGAYTYDPIGQFDFLAAGEPFTDTFGYIVSDGIDVSTATVTITITGVNDPPVANDDPGITTVKDTPVTIDVLANDTDVDGDALEVFWFSQPAGGTVTLNPDGTLTYTPTLSGQYSFTYQASDGISESNVATVTITVNAPPVANDDSADTPEDTPVTIDVALNDTDVDGNLNPASITVISGPVNGTVTSNGDGTFTYTPNPNFYGSDSFTYTIADDGGLTSDEATVTINVTSVNDPPVANDDSAEININESPAVNIDVTANDTDVDDTINPASVATVSVPISGTVSVDPVSGVVTYTPDEDFVGQDTFEYEVCDTGMPILCDTATVTVTVSGNRPPVANDDQVETPQGTPVIIDVLANDTDEDGDTLTVTQFSQGSRGTVTTNADGTLTYAPNSNFKGTDSFTYTISDGRGGVDTAMVTITTQKPAG